MPRGVTPKERMKRSVVTLAKNLKPSGRLNTDDIKVAGEMRKSMTRKDYKMTNIKRKTDEAIYKDANSLKNAANITEDLVRKYKKFTSTPAGQTKSTKTPKQSIFQQLKKAQALRKK